VHLLGFGGHFCSDKLGGGGSSEGRRVLLELFR